jgi:uncharacterized protein YegL
MTEQQSISTTEVASTAPSGLRSAGDAALALGATSPVLPGALSETVLFLIDASGSMADDGKRAALDHAVTALIERLALSRTRSWHAGAIVYGPGDQADVHREIRPVGSWLRWPQLPANGSSPLGAAVALATEVVDSVAGQPVSLVLFTDGFPTDDWRPALLRLVDAAPRARRFAVGIGADADLEVLEAFASPPVEHHVLRTDEVSDIPGIVESLAGWLPSSHDERGFVSFELAAN